MDGGPAVVATVVDLKRVDLKRLYELLEVKLLVYLDEKVVGIDKVSEALGRELKLCGVPAAAVQ